MNAIVDMSEMELLAAGLTARFSGTDTSEIEAEALRRIKERYGLSEDNEELRLRQHQLQANLDEIRNQCRKIGTAVSSIYDELDEIQEEQVS